MKKLISIMLSLTLLFSVFTVMSVNTAAAKENVAASGTTGDCTWTLSDNGTLTISGNGATASYDDEENPAPWSGFEVKNLVIEDGVTWLRSFNFSGLDIESVVIPDSVTQIGMMVFPDCTSLKTVTMSENVKQIGGGAFRNCTSLESIDLPECLESVGPFAFEGCEKLDDFVFPDSLYDVGAGAFGGTGWMNAQPDGAVYANKVLLGYKGHAEEPFTLEIKDGTATVAAGAFSGMWDHDMITDIKFPASLWGIGMNAFWDLNGLTRVEIPATVTQIWPGGIGYGFDETIEDVVKNPNLVIAGVKGSEAERYANENEIPFEEIVPVVIGDINGDNSVDILDATLAQKHSAGKADLTEEQLAVADVNNDKNVDILDATEIQKFAAGKITEFKKKA